MQPMNLHVILADDHRVLLEGLSYLLSESDVEVLAQTTDRDELPALIAGRQQEILEHVADGQTSKHIAGRLGIQTRTVEHHRQPIRAKLRARSSSEMVLQAQQRGLL